MGRGIEVGRFRSWTFSVARLINEVAIQSVAAAQLILAIGAAVFVYGMFADRSPPFVLLSVEPAAARPGETVVIRAKVKRDLSRGCSADFSRYMWGATATEGADVETRFVLGATHASPDMLAMMDKRWPDGLVIAERVPDRMSPGPARITADIEYVCNKAQALWPINVHAEFPFQVLP